jgi:hypothetical protein
MAVKHIAAAIGLALVAIPAAVASPSRSRRPDRVAENPGSANSIVVGNASVANVAVHAQHVARHRQIVRLYGRWFSMVLDARLLEPDPGRRAGYTT